MSDYWIKLYHEIIDDPKMATLPDRLWRRSVELFLLAGKLCPDKSGILPNTKQLAWMLRMNTDDLQGDIDQLVNTGIVESIPNGWLVVNFKKRQEPVSSKERKQKQREKENRDQYYGDDDVTNSSRNVTQSRLTDNRLTESETKTEVEAESDDSPDLFSQTQRMIESVIGISPVGEAGIKAVTEIAGMGATLEDIQAGYQWLKENRGDGRPIQYCSSLVGPIRTAIAKRLQSAPPLKKRRTEKIKDPVTGEIIEVIV